MRTLNRSHLCLHDSFETGLRLYISRLDCQYRYAVVAVSHLQMRYSVNAVSYREKDVTHGTAGMMTTILNFLPCRAAEMIR